MEKKLLETCGLKDMKKNSRIIHKLMQICFKQEVNLKTNLLLQKILKLNLAIKLDRSRL